MVALQGAVRELGNGVDVAVVCSAIAAVHGAQVPQEALGEALTRAGLTHRQALIVYDKVVVVRVCVVCMDDGVCVWMVCVCVCMCVYVCVCVCVALRAPISWFRLRVGVMGTMDVPRRALWTVWCECECGLYVWVNCWRGESGVVCGTVCLLPARV